MKAIRIFLLILIIIGLAALVTQKFWVPVLVQKIIVSEGIPTPLPVVWITPTSKDDRQCYSYDQAATKDAPYAVQEFITLNINGSTVTGTKTGTQNGPDMTNGYEGTLKGEITGSTLNALFSYMIEGSANSEQEIYTLKSDQTGIEKLRYPLKEKGKILVPDTTKPFTKILYSRVSCKA